MARDPATRISNPIRLDKKILRVSLEVSKDRRGPRRRSLIFTRPAPPVGGLLGTCALDFSIFISDPIERLYTIEALIRLAELFT